MSQILEFFKKFAVWTWRIIEMMLEFLGYAILLIFDFWFIAVVAIFILVAWYLGLIE